MLGKMRDERAEPEQRSSFPQVEVCPRSLDTRGGKIVMDKSAMERSHRDLLPNYQWGLTLQSEILICSWVGSLIPFFVLILPQVIWLVSQKCSNVSATIIIFLLTAFSGNGKQHNSEQILLLPSKENWGEQSFARDSPALGTRILIYKKATVNATFWRLLPFS